MKPEEIDKLYRSLYDKQSFAFEEKHWAAFKNQRQGRRYSGSWPFLFVYLISGVFAAFMLFTTANLSSSSNISAAVIGHNNASESSSIQTTAELNNELFNTSNTPADLATNEAIKPSVAAEKAVSESRNLPNSMNKDEISTTYEVESHETIDRKMYFAMLTLPAYYGSSSIPQEREQRLLSDKMGLTPNEKEVDVAENRIIFSAENYESRVSTDQALDYKEDVRNELANKPAPMVLSSPTSKVTEEIVEGTGITSDLKWETPEGLAEMSGAKREQFAGLSRMKIKTPSINLPDWNFRVSKGKNHWGGLPRLARPLNFKVFVGHYWGMSYDVPPTLAEVNNQPHMQNVEVLAELIVRNRVSFQGGLGFSNIYEKQTFDWIETSGNQKLIEEELKISALNVPVNVNYNLSFWRLHWKMGTGFTVGFVLNSRGNLVDPRENPPVFGPSGAVYNTFFMDWNFYNEIGMLITDHWAVTLKPEVKVNINSMYTSSFWLPRKNLYYGVGFGIIYSW